jgi:hypothetical protein
MALAMCGIEPHQFHLSDEIFTFKVIAVSVSGI